MADFLGEGLSREQPTDNKDGYPYCLLLVVLILFNSFVLSELLYLSVIINNYFVIQTI